MGAKRTCLTVGALAVAAVVGLLVVRRHLVLAPGVRVTFWARSATNAVCRVAWTTPENRAFAPVQEVRVDILSGENAIVADLPVRTRLTGLRLTAPGVELGRVTVLGNRHVLRCDTPEDIPAEPNLPAARLPRWRSSP